MTADWYDDTALPDRHAADRRAWVQLGLALVGAAAVLGSIAGTAFGWTRTLCWCCDENEDPL